MYIFEQKYTLYKMTSHFGVLKLIYYKMGGFPPSNHYKMDLENPVYMGLDSSPFYRGNFYEDPKWDLSPTWIHEKDGRPKILAIRKSESQRSWMSSNPSRRWWNSKILQSSSVCFPWIFSGGFRGEKNDSVKPSMIVQNDEPCGSHWEGGFHSHGATPIARWFIEDTSIWWGLNGWFRA